jgi:branched-chain amino acid transport system permease protein
LDIKTDYMDDIKIFKEKATLIWFFILVAFLLLVPLFVGDYIMYMLSLTGIYIIVSLGLNLLSGYAGQISLGHAAFMAIGAYSSAYLTVKLGFPFWFALPASGAVTAVAGILIGLAALRLSGFYLAIATMAFAFIVDEVILNWESVTNGANGIKLSAPSIGPLILDTDAGLYYFILAISLIMLWGAKNITRSSLGRAFIAIRDSETAAETMGVNLYTYKTIAFIISAFYTGIAGSLFAHFIKYISPSNFTLLDSIGFIIMILVGGTGTILGSVYGAFFITFLPEGIRFLKDIFPFFVLETGLQGLVYGLILLLFILFEPTGLYGRWLKIKRYWKVFPLK